MTVHYLMLMAARQVTGGHIVLMLVCGLLLFVALLLGYSVLAISGMASRGEEEAER